VIFFSNMHWFAAASLIGISPDSSLQVTDSELIPGGRNIRVTEENKHEYVDRVVEHRLTTAIRPQINAFMEGFNELIPRELISIFNGKELELLISGLPDIDCEFTIM
jgi:E3 ubiquitin-protein ligase HUWE1